MPFFPPLSMKTTSPYVPVTVSTTPITQQSYTPSNTQDEHGAANTSAPTPTK